jgi:ATP-binding cassette subfamily F protein 3
VLLLDEPTNHLDLESKEVLLDALADYAGTLILVSHDRYFVDRLAGKVVEVGGGEALLYPGGYEDFLDWKRRREAGEDAAVPHVPLARREEQDGVASKAAPPAPAPPPPPPAPAPGAGKTAKRKAKAAAGSNGKPARAGATPPANPMAPRLRKTGTPPERQVLERELKKMRTRLTELEKRVGQTEQAVKTTEEEMASPGFYDDRERAAVAAETHQKLMWEAGELMSQWEALQAEVDERAARLAELTPAPAAQRAR